MADFDKIKRNIKRMIDQGAPEPDIDAYVTSEGVTPHQVRASGMTREQMKDYYMRNRDDFADFIGSELQKPLDGETPEQTDQRLYGKPMPGVSKLQSGVMGAADTLSWGLGDEMAAGVESVIGNRSYDQALQNQRKMASTALEENPWSYRGGQVAGAVLPAVVTGGGSTAGGIGGQVLRGAGSGAAQGAAYGFNSGEGGFGNRASNAANSAAWGGLLGGAFPVLAKGIGAGVNSLFAPKTVAPTTDAIKAAAQQSYKAADDMGVVLSPQGFDDIAAKIENAVGEKGFFAPNQRELANSLDILNQYRGSPVPLSILQDIRTKIGSAYSPQNPNQNRLMGEAIEALDNALSDINPSQVVSGDATAAASVLDDARANWTKFRKAETLDKVSENAKNTVGANYTEAGYQTAIRQQLRALAKDDFKNARFFTPEERKLVLEVTRGGSVENLMRKMGKYSLTSPGGPGRSALAGLVASWFGGPVAGAGVSGALTGAGTMAKPIATKMGKKAFDKLSETVRAGGLLSASSPYAGPARKGASMLLGSQAGLLGEALGSQFPIAGPLLGLLSSPNTRR